jgi:hypothetical protein
MGPYSHIILANDLEKHIKPNNTREYYWGTIAPDTRYLMKGMSRYQTHISSDEILDYLHRHPQLKSFIQGYLVHCLADQLEMSEIMQRKFPLSWQKDKFSSRQCTVILELFNVLRTRPPEKSISENYNAVLEGIGIGKEQAMKFSKEMNQYLTTPSVISLLSMYQKIGLANNGRIEKYQIAFQRFQKNWLRKNMILFGLHVGRINNEIASLVKSNLPKEVL